MGECDLSIFNFVIQPKKGFTVTLKTSGGHKLDVEYLYVLTKRVDGVQEDRTFWFSCESYHFRGGNRKLSKMCKYSNIVS